MKSYKITNINIKNLVDVKIVWKVLISIEDVEDGQDSLWLASLQL